ncbi:hypothetical protein ACFQZJ_02500 [Maribacter chungangensis]|uniref:Glycosyl hydrolase n=1 Tax=Maribacter chungangensis TaxID=1069117 RepID=A0ABW3AZL7_9FLAO
MSFRLSLFVCLAMLFLSCEKDSVTELNVFEVTQEILPNPPKTNNSSSLDTPVINWVVGMQHDSGLLESAAHTNFVSLYDNALATILFISINKKEKAEKVLDFYQSKMQEEVLRNGGFYQFRNINGGEGERIWMGDNAWLLIAINQYKETYGSTKYDAMASGLDKWLRSLQLENGGLRGGLDQDGSEIPLVTEGIITAFNAVQGFDDFHVNILNYLKNERWDPENQIFLSWPENPAYAYAMDLHSLSSIMLDGLSTNVLIQADRYLTQQELTVNGEMISGYCFDEDRDVVWLEGTAQMAVAFQAQGDREKAETLIKELEKSIISSTMLENAKGIPYSSNHGTSYGTAMLWDHADTTPALSSTVWYLFAKNYFNPLQLGKKNDVPESFKFWSQEPSS